MGTVTLNFPKPPAPEVFAMLSGAGFEAIPDKQLLRANDTPKAREIANLASLLQLRLGPGNRWPEQIMPANAIAFLYPTDKVSTDTHTFQNREAEYSEESVQKIVERYNPNYFEPITVFEVNDQYVVLSGHSRFEAAKQLGLAQIPIRVFNGTQSEAVTYAKGIANRSGTPETLVESINVYAAMRDGTDGHEKHEQAELKRVFNGRGLHSAKNLELLTHLPKRCKWYEALRDENRIEELPKFELIVRWVADLKTKFPDKYTVARLNETFDYCYDKDGHTHKKADLVGEIEAALANAFLQEGEPLNLDGSAKTGAAADRTTAAHIQQIRELRKMNRRYEELNKSGITIEERRENGRRIQANLNKIEQLEQQVSGIQSNNVGLF